MSKEIDLLNNAFRLVNTDYSIGYDSLLDIMADIICTLFNESDKTKVYYFSTPIWDYLSNSWKEPTVARINLVNEEEEVCKKFKNDNDNRDNWIRIEDKVENKNSTKYDETTYFRFFKEARKLFSFIEFFTQRVKRINPIYTIEFSANNKEIKYDSGQSKLSCSKESLQNIGEFIEQTKVLLEEDAVLTEDAEKELDAFRKFLIKYKEYFKDLKYIYLITSRLYKQDNGVYIGSGGVVLVCKGALDGIILQRISVLTNLCYRELGGKNWAERCRKESIKSAKAAIMARNFSHNIGSHIMAYIKQGLLSTSSMMEHKVLENLVSHPQPLKELYNKFKSLTYEQVMADYYKLVEKSATNALIADSDQPNLVEMPYLVGLGRFMNYIQERQDFIATISTDYIPQSVPVNFKEAIYDELNPDLRYLRHADRLHTGSRPKNMLLSYIAKSEGYERPDFFEEEVDQKRRQDDIIIKFGKFDGLNDVRLTGNKEKQRRGNLYLQGFGEGALDLARMKRYNIGLPGGITGRQALFSIIENFIRNSAKHGGKNESNLTIEIDLLDLKKELPGANCFDGYLKAATKDGQSFYVDDFKDELQGYYSNTDDGNDLYLMILSSNKLADAEVIWHLQENLKEPFLESNGSMSQKCKGLKEMRISAAWIRGLEVHDVAKGQDPNRRPYPKKCPLITLAAKKVEEKDNLYKIYYLICLPKSNVMAYVVDGGKKPSICDNDNQDITVLTLNEFKTKKNRCFDIICAKNDTVKETIKELIGSEMRLRVEEYGGKETAKNFIQKIYKAWVFGNTGTDPLPPIIIDDNLFSDSLKDDDIVIKSYTYGKGEEKREAKIVWEGSTDYSEQCYSKQYFYIKHLESRTEFFDFLKKVNMGRSESNRPAFAESISGGNSTDRLIRSTIIDKIWYYKHLHAIGSKVAVFDERLFHFLTGLDENSCLTQKITKHLPIVYAFKNVYAFLLKYNEKRKCFDIYGYNGYDYSENKVETVIAKVGTIGTIIKSDEEKIVVKRRKGYKGPCKFDLFSIHQGLLDKLYEKLSKKSSEERKEVTKALYQGVIGKKAEEVSEITIYSGMTIHSGRSKPSVDDMPQHIPFIQYAAIENAFLDCKYTLVELLELAQYDDGN